MPSQAEITKFDQSRIHKIYEKWPEHFKEASKISAKIDHGADFYGSVILCGMGGSATSCDILNDMMHNYSNTSSVVLRGDRMPHFVNKKSLVIINSVSGNTQESIGMMENASKKGAEVICISSNGMMKEIAGKKGHKHISIPNLSVPRASLPYLVMPGIKLIDSFLSEPLGKEISYTYHSLEEVRKKVSIMTPRNSNTARKIAYFLRAGFAFCFTSPQLVTVGTRFKNSLNENAKVHCLNESILEASHNEIVPFTFKNKGLVSRVLLLRWSRDPEVVRERFGKIKSLFSSIKQPMMELTSDEENLLNASLSSIYMLDYSTIYMAISRKLDPSSTPAIDILKKLASRRNGPAP